MRTPRPLLLVSLAIVAALVSQAACEDNKGYVYSAQKWNADDACVEPYTPIDVVQGEGADSTCPASCMTVGSDLYVSTVCPPLPTNATPVDATDPGCKAAIEAQKKGVTCGADASAEAGDDGGDKDSSDDSGDDSGEDAPADAPADVRDAATDG